MKNTEHGIIYGMGMTKENAALNFVNNLQKNIPREAGVYDFFLRSPLDLEIETSLSGDTQYLYRLRGHFLVASR